MYRARQHRIDLRRSQKLDIAHVWNCIPAELSSRHGEIYESSTGDRARRVPPIESFAALLGAAPRGTASSPADLCVSAQCIGTASVLQSWVREASRRIAPVIDPIWRTSNTTTTPPRIGFFIAYSCRRRLYLAISFRRQSQQQKPSTPPWI